MKQTFTFRSLLAVFLLFGPGALVAQETNSAKHCLWEAQKGTTRVYLFGTIHLSSSNFFPLPAVVEQAYSRSETLMFESDLDEQNSVEGRSKGWAATQYPPGDSLRNHVSSEVYSNVQAHLIEARLDPTRFDSTKPFMLSMALTEYAAEKLGLDRSRSIDRHFWDRAKRDKKRVIPLETFDETLKILTSLNDSQQEYMLTETLRDIAKTNHMMQDVTTAWLHGDTDKIDKLVFDAVRRNPKVGKILTTDRNKKWMPSIEAQIKRGEKLFIAVGLAHLLGKDSLVDLLSKHGFKVRQL